MTTTPDTLRASGSTQREEVVKEEMERIDVDPATEDPSEETEIKWRTPGFTRMRLEWRGDDLPMMQQVHAVVEERLIHAFQDAYAVMNEVYDVVRTAEDDGQGSPLTDRFGFVVWARNPITGSFEEDWSKMGLKERENWLFSITTRIFDWEQRSAALWTEAMMAKAQYEERFSIAYDEPVARLTVDDRTARGKIDAAEERYFAIYCSALSRRADAIVRSMALLAQRLKDTMA